MKCTLIQIYPYTGVPFSIVNPNRVMFSSTIILSHPLVGKLSNRRFCLCGRQILQVNPTFRGWILRNKVQLVFSQLIELSQEWINQRVV